MKLIFVGPQGSGKGTYGKIIAKRLGVPHISMGDLLREYSGKYKKQIDKKINAGKLISASLSIKILKERIEKSDAEGGFILDGFPRNLKQAECLGKISKIDRVFEIDVPENISIKRLNGRWSCPKCGTPYNIYFEPKPKIQGVCDKDGAELIQRKDDSDVNIIKFRLKTYHTETEPILKYYKNKVVRIDGNQSIDNTVEEILNKLKQPKS